MVLAEQDSCISVTYELRNATSVDSGEYFCELTFANHTTIRHSAGTLGVVGEFALILIPYCLD